MKSNETNDNNDSKSTVLVKYTARVKINLRVPAYSSLIVTEESNLIPTRPSYHEV